MNNQDIDNLFKEKLEGLEVNPPALAWDRISGNIYQKKTERRSMVFWYAAACISFLTFGVSLYYQMNKSALSNVQAVKSSEVSPIPTKSTEFIPENRLAVSLPGNSNKKLAVKFKNRELKKETKINTQLVEESIVSKTKEINELKKDSGLSVKEMPSPYQSQGNMIVESTFKQNKADETEVLVTILKGQDGLATIDKTPVSFKSKLRKAYKKVMDYKNGETELNLDRDKILAFTKKDKQNSDNN
jgi:hypothetical protein